MTADDWLFEGLPGLLARAAALLPATGAGVVRHDGADRLVLSFCDHAQGLTGFSVHDRDLPGAFWPGTAKEPQVLSLRPSGDAAAQHILVCPVDDSAQALLFVVRLARPASLSDSDRTQLGILAADVAQLVNQTESAAAELDRLRKAAAVDRVLPVLFKAVTMPQIADRLSTLGSDVRVCDSIVIDDVGDAAPVAIENPWPVHSIRRRTGCIPLANTASRSVWRFGVTRPS